MGKLVTILGACVMAAGGAAYGLYAYTEVTEPVIDPHDCPIAQMKCCATPTLSTGDETTPLLAVSGPVGMFATVPVKAEVSACGTGKSVVNFICCEEPASDQSLEAVAGSAAALARK